MTRFAVAYFAAALFMTVFDLVWLRTLGGAIFRAEVGTMLTDNPNIVAAVLFYLLYVLGLMIFGVAPAFRSGTVSSAFVYGALFGFFCYMTFEMTNLAVLKLWSVKVAIVDIAWGSMISGVSAAVGFYAARTMGPA